MNEKEMAVTFARIIDDKIAKAVEPLNLQIATQKTITANLSEIIEVVKEFGLDNHSTFEELKQSQVDANESIISVVKEQGDTLGDFDEFQKELAELKTLITLNGLEQNNKINEVKQIIIDTCSEIAKSSDDKFNKLTDYVDDKNDTMAKLVENNHVASIDHISKINSEHSTFSNKKFEVKTLEQTNKINDELLRLNNHINSKLTSLKGDKGDAGEKGKQGDSGFLSRVRKWETGSITKGNEAVTHKNGLWLCLSEQTAQEPIAGGDWELVINGIASLDLVDHELSLVRTSGDTEQLGNVGFEYRGDYVAKTMYGKYDLVSKDGTTFISLNKDNKNSPPSNTWKALAKRGQRGAQGKDGGIGFNADDIYATVREMIDEAK